MIDWAGKSINQIDNNYQLELSRACSPRIASASCSANYYLHRDESLLALVDDLYLRTLLSCAHEQKVQGGAVDRHGQ